LGGGGGGEIIGIFFGKYIFLVYVSLILIFGRRGGEN